jgi:uncharacterized protein YecT (DUF1311 family)
MLSRLIAVAAIGLVSSATLAAEKAEKEPSCDGSTYQIVECQKARLARLDQRLNAAYQQALKDASPGQLEQLRIAQRLWLQYRDANCLFYGKGEGTIARIEAGSCMLSMTEARARELEEIGRQ